MNIPQQMKLSVCLIVRNEEALLENCLKSVSQLADQLVVVDTGSTDKTLEIARSFNAEIYHFKWCDDFAAARNESIKYATGDWILWIDADERLSEASVPAFKKLLTPELKPVIYKLRIKNLKEDGLNYTWSDAHRLFTNKRGINFTGKIHEQISPSAKKLGALERSCTVILDHLGYSFTGQAKTDKQARNRNILESEVLANPNSAYSHYTLAHNYKVDGKLIEAEKHYRIALQLKQFDPSMEASLLNNYADTLFDLGRLGEVNPLINKSLKLKKRQNAAYFLRYRLAMASKKIDEAIEALAKVESVNRLIQSSGTEISTDIEIDQPTISKSLGDLYAQAEKWAEAAQSYKACMEVVKDNTSVLKNYFKVLERLEDWPTALDVLAKLIQLEGELPAYLNAIANILLRMGEYDASLQVYLRLVQLKPDDANAKRKIASIYAKLGQLDKANEWLTQ